MFGSSNNDNQQVDDTVVQPDDQAVPSVSLDDIVADPGGNPANNNVDVTDAGQPPAVAPPPLPSEAPEAIESPAPEAEAVPEAAPDDMPIENNSFLDDNSSPEPIETPEPEVTETTPEPASDSPTPASDTPATTAVPSELLDLKQQALQELSPLVYKLDQSPEERFKTTMMMIQATDNHDLVKDAYEAAHAIPEEKARAQALLDVVNEINYFTQNNSN